MDKKHEIERKLNENLAFNFYNEEEVSQEEQQYLNELIDEGIEAGSNYALRLRATELYEKWKSNSSDKKCPKEIN